MGHLLRIVENLAKIRDMTWWQSKFYGLQTVSYRSMDYFYETQPNPNPYSYFAHHAPRQWHQFEVVCMCIT